MTQIIHHQNHEHTMNHVINDPIHGPMSFTPQDKHLLKPFIDSREMQRLRQIRQLGLADLVFPGAVHTRFNHSIGACFIAKLMVETLGPTHSTKTSKNHREATLLSCLLHDIGHGPFSHAFEDLFKTPTTTITHEDWTREFINSLASATQTKAPLCDLQKIITAAICHEDPGELDDRSGLLLDIVSSQLDADRLDYLLRDCHFCGVSYGIYDLRWLLACLVRVEESPNHNRLGITRKGIGVIEQYLLARRLMHENVYYHGKVKAAEFLLVEFLKELLKVQEQTSIADNRLTGSLALGSFLRATSTFIHTPAPTTEEAKKVKEKFIHAAFEDYRLISDADIWLALRLTADAPSNQKNGTLTQLAQRLLSRRLPKVFPVHRSHLEGAKHVVSRFREAKRLEHWKLGIMEFPVNAYKSDRDPILIRLDDGTTRTLGMASGVVDAVEDRREFFSYLRIDPEIPDYDQRALLGTLCEKHYLATNKQNMSSEKSDRKTPRRSGALRRTWRTREASSHPAKAKEG